MYQIKILPKNFSVMWTWDRIKKWFSCKEYSYIFCYKLLLVTILSLFFHIINNFFTPPPNPQLFLVPTNCTWLEFLSPYLAPQLICFPVTLHLTKKKVKNFTEVLWDMPTSVSSNHYSHSILVMFVAIFTF